MKSVHVLIKGKVQGVFFRDYTQRQAKQLNISGWVRNMPDGSVEAMLSGKVKNVDEMIEWLHEGSPLSHVTTIDIEEILPTEKFSDFEIRYTTT